MIDSGIFSVQENIFKNKLRFWPLTLETSGRPFSVGKFVAKQLLQFDYNFKNRGDFLPFSGETDKGVFLWIGCRVLPATRLWNKV